MNVLRDEHDQDIMFVCLMAFFTSGINAIVAYLLDSLAFVQCVQWTTVGTFGTFEYQYLILYSSKYYTF